MKEHNSSHDICIFCAMYEEAEAILNEFSTRFNVSFTKAFSRRDRYEYRHATIQNAQAEPLTVLVTSPSDRGPVQTGLDLKPFLDEFRPRFAAMTGICVGDQKKVQLGDLIVAECAYFYEEGKIIGGPDGQATHLLETETVASTSQVLQYVRGFDGWKEPLREMKRIRLKRELKPNIDDVDKLHDAFIASLMIYDQFTRLPYAEVLSQISLLNSEKLTRLPLPYSRLFWFGRSQLNALLYSIIENHQKGNKDLGDILSILLLAEDEKNNNSKMSIRQVRDEAISLLVAGAETVAMAILWACYLLSQNPKVEAKLQTELVAALNGQSATIEKFTHLKYTRMILSEAMRLYPPAHAIGRRSIEESANLSIHWQIVTHICFKMKAA